MGTKCMSNCLSSGHSLNSTAVPVTPVQLKHELKDDCKAKKVRRCLKRRSGTNYGAVGNSSEEESDCEQSIKVSAKWQPKDACRPILDEAPVFHPTDEEFKNPIAYITSIRPKAESYGICRIVPPHHWKPPCPLKEENIWKCAKFTTRVQQLDKLQNREPVRKKSRNNAQKKRKRRRRMKFGMTRRRNASAVASDANDCAGSDSEEKFGFQTGPDFTLESFQKFTNIFKERYFITKSENINTSEESQKNWVPSVEEIEGEFWRIVEKSTEEVEVHYGADLETGVFPSGFPKGLQSSENNTNQYVTSGWNLNNLPRSPGSILAFEKEDISGVLVPWLYIGMCLSSFCWHVEDHHLYSLNYLHFGDPKVWYGVPGSDAVKLESAMRKNLPELFEEQPHLLNELVTQLSPTVLRSEGVLVYRAVQHAGEFLLTFPRAYHAGFNCGFNCAEAVNVAPVDWLTHGQCAIELYSEQCRKTSVSHDKLLLAAACKAVTSLMEISFQRSNPENLGWMMACGKNGTLTEAIKDRVAMEKDRRQNVVLSCEVRKMDTSVDSSDDKECVYCFYDLYLSAAGCACSPNRFTCLKHAKMLCSCDASRKFYLYRYDTSQLDTLLHALEGDIVSVGKWLEDLGLFSSLVNPEQNKTAQEKHDVDSQGHKMDNNDINTEIHDFHHPIQVLNRICLDRAKEVHNTSDPCEYASDTVHVVSELSCEKQKQIPEGILKGEEKSKCFGRESISEPNVIGSRDLHEASRWSGVSNEHSTEIDMKDPGKELPDDLERLEVSLDKSKVISISEKVLIKQDPSSGIKTTLINGVRKDKTPLNSDIMTTTNHIVGTRIEQNFFPQNHLDFTPEIYSNRNSDGASCSKCFEKSNTHGTVAFGFDLQLSQPWLCTSDDKSIQSTSTGSFRINKFNKSVGELEISCRTTYFVEVLDLGTVTTGRLWCNRQAIFPKGFRSRVQFINMLDPTNTCSYISEVLDAGFLGPLFKVTLENNPEECFTGVSAEECWMLVQRKCHEAIARLHSEGISFSVLQHPAVINGLEMFGFLSPNIIQAIEYLDLDHQSSEYWENKECDKSSFEHKHFNCTLESTTGSINNSSMSKTRLFGVDLV